MELLDTTLREGEQSPGVSFSVKEKIKLAQMLDDFGVEMIEAGHPVVSKKVEESVRQIAGLGLNAKVLSHNRALKTDIDKSIGCGIEMVAIFLASSNILQTST